MPFLLFLFPIGEVTECSQKVCFPLFCRTLLLLVFCLEIRNYELFKLHLVSGNFSIGLYFSHSLWDMWQMLRLFIWLNFSYSQYPMVCRETFHFGFRSQRLK